MKSSVNSDQDQLQQEKIPEEGQEKPTYEQLEGVVEYLREELEAVRKNKEQSARQSAMELATDLYRLNPHWPMAQFFPLCEDCLKWIKG